MLDFTYNGRRYAGWTFNDAIAAGVPAAVVGAAVKATARALVGDLLDGYRAALSSRSAGKLAEYRVKESLAADPASANTEEATKVHTCELTESRRARPRCPAPRAGATNDVAAMASPMPIEMVRNWMELA